MSSTHLSLILRQVQMLVTEVALVIHAARVISDALEDAVLLLYHDSALPNFCNLLFCSFHWLDVLKIGCLILMLYQHSLNISF